MATSEVSGSKHELPNMKGADGRDKPGGRDGTGETEQEEFRIDRKGSDSSKGNGALSDGRWENDGNEISVPGSSSKAGGREQNANLV
ncbi:hypothetical protein CVT25_011957 [Psilocybe cyanescens]|uniref:Uncharacterized protein n=1 Tax=Psilocybe cyanescens TaxID=93625 RepID=A0A409XA77_PSICY|nr:hypothetical protein CVT25_011957 [Psilocybe cyanescens]